MAGAQAAAVLHILEGLWTNFDELFTEIDSEGRWREQHGAHWRFGDVPYHMMYFDREFVAEAIERGQNVPVAKQHTMRSLRELNQWNERMFSQRPGEETPRLSLSRWRAVRERVRTRVSDFDDKAMDNPAWVALPGCGWITAGAALSSCIAHTWSEFVQLSYHAGIVTIEPAAEATHAALGDLLSLMPMLFDREAAGETRLTTILRFTGPGGGDWTLDVVGGEASLVEGALPSPHLVITQSPVTFELVRAGKLDIVEAIEAEAVHVEGAAYLENFGRYFPEPTLDTQIPPANPGAAD